MASFLRRWPGFFGTDAQQPELLHLGIGNKSQFRVFEHVLDEYRPREPNDIHGRPRLWQAAIVLPETSHEALRDSHNVDGLARSRLPVDQEPLVRCIGVEQVLIK